MAQRRNDKRKKRVKKRADKRLVAKRQHALTTKVAKAVKKRQAAGMSEDEAIEDLLDNPEKSDPWPKDRRGAQEALRGVRAEADEGKDYSLKEKRAFAKKAQAGIKKRMAAGMTEDEAIQHLVGEDPTMRDVIHQHGTQADRADEVALREVIQKLLGAGGTPDEVFQLVRAKVDEIAKEHLGGRSKKVVAAAKKDVGGKLMLIASEALLAAGHSDDDIEAAAERVLEGTEINPMDLSLRAFIQRGFAKGETADQIEEDLMGGAEPDLTRQVRRNGRKRIRQMIEEVGTTTANQTLDRISVGMSKDEREEFINRVVVQSARDGGDPQLDVERIQAIADEINARRGMSHAELRTKLMGELTGDEPLHLRVTGTGAHAGGVVEPDHPGFTEAIDATLEPLNKEERELFLEWAFNHVRKAKATGKAPEPFDVTEAVQNLLTRRSFVDKLRDDVRVQLLNGVAPEDIEKAIETRYGPVTKDEDMDWQHEANKTIRSVIENASSKDVETIIRGARAQGPESLRYIQDIVADRVMDESARDSGEERPPKLVSDGAWPQFQSKTRQTPQEQSVESYMEALTSAYQLTKSQNNRDLQREGTFVWRCLRDARVFHFDADTYVGLYQEIDRYTTEELAGQPYHAPGTYRKHERVPREEVDALKAAVLRESKRVPYPEKFPFPCVFLGYGGGVQQSRVHLMMSAPAALRERIELGAVLGHLMTDDGSVYACVKAGCRMDDGQLTGVIWFEPLRGPSGSWVRSEVNLEPWILTSLIGIINDHRTFILEANMSTALRKDYKRNRKGMGLKPNRQAYTPPPYYTLRMKSKLIREKARKALPHPAPPKTYKTDVRAHERCRISRGNLPLDPETGAKLRKRGYKIFTTNALDLDTYRRLHERGQPYKKSDEWLAILVTWIGEHMTSNDPALPYIPAVRVPGEVHLKPRQPTGGWADDPRA